MKTSKDELQVVQTMAINSLVLLAQVRNRFDEEPLAGLAQSIKATGILQPLLIRRDGSRFVVVEGERRLRAARLAGLTSVPVIIDDRELSDAEVVYRQLVLNCSREDLQPLEKAKAIGRLMQLTECSAGDVAVKLGMSPGTVSKLLSLLSLPEPVQEQVVGGSLALTTAYELSRVEDPERQRDLAAQAANGALRREDVAVRSKSRKPGRRASGKRPRDGNSRVSIRLDAKRSVTVAGPSLSLALVIEWLSELVERLRGAQGQSAELAEAVQLVSQHS